MNKWLHVIGICGVTTSGLAVSFKNNGWRVSGSDKGFFPPVSDYLLDQDIQILPGFKKERLTVNNKHPDLVIFQGTKGKFNEEILEAHKLDLKIMSYPEVLEKFLINKNRSIVVCGSYGKTTTTAILVNIFKIAGYKVNYMYGGLNPQSFPHVFFNEMSDYSIVEGDEYITSYQDTRSKFFLYHPKLVILTGISWDHADVFKDERSYIENYIKFIESIPAGGLLVYNQEDKNSIMVSKHAKCRTIGFSLTSVNRPQKADWEIIYDSKPLPCLIKNFKEKINLEIIPFKRNVPGKVNDLNILAATALSSELGIKNSVIQEGIDSFNGIKRRMEIRYRNDDLLIIDDFGSTPSKLKTTLNTINEDFPGYKTLVIFEPSAGSRIKESLSAYSNLSVDPDLMIIPKFTILPVSKNIERFNELELTSKLMSIGINAEAILEDDLLIKKVMEFIKANKKTLILFMGSHSFRQIIENLIEEVKKWKK